MANGPKVDIQLHTTATGNGVEETVKGLDQLAQKAGGLSDDVKLPGADPATSAALKQTTAALEKTEDALKDVGTAGKAVEAENKKVADRFREMSKTATDANGSLESLEENARRLDAELKKLAPHTQQFRDTAGALGQARAKINETRADAEKYAKAAGGAAGASRNMGMATLEVSRAFEDMQYGMKGALNNLPGLITMLGGTAGLAGVLSIVAVGASIFFDKLEAIKKEAKDAGEGAKKTAEDFKNLVHEENAAELERLANAAANTAQQMANLADEEVKLIDSAQKVADSNRKKADAMDQLALANLKYQKEVLGLDTSEAERALEQRKRERDAQAGLDAEAARVAKVKTEYDNLNESISTAKDELAKLATKRDELEVKKASTEKLLGAWSSQTGETGKVADLTQKLDRITQELDGVKASMKDSDAAIGKITTEAWQKASEIDRVAKEAAAESDAISAQLEASNGAAAIDEAITRSREAKDKAMESTQKAVAALEAESENLSEKDKATLEAMKASIADGEQTAQEQRENASRLASLMSSFKTDYKTQTGLMEDLAVLQNMTAGSMMRIKGEVESIKRQLGMPAPTRPR